MILAFEFLSLIDKPNWEEYTSQFDESGFEIYSSRELVDADEELRITSRDLEAKLYTSETLDQIRSRFFEVSEIASQLDHEEKSRLLER